MRGMRLTPVEKNRRYYATEKGRRRQKEANQRAWAKYRVQRLAASREKYRLKKLQLDALKTGPCLDCGQLYPPYVMDWHHRDPSTKVAKVAPMLAYYKWPVIMAEIAKCDLLCSNCHRIREWGENGLRRKALAA